MANKGSMAFDWAKVQARLYDMADPTKHWGARGIVQWNATVVSGAIGLAFDRNADLGNVATRFLGIYNNSLTTGYVCGASFIRNLPIYETTNMGNVTPDGGDPCAPMDLYYLLLAKKVLGSLLPEFPSPSEVYNGWPVYIAGYYGMYHMHYGTVYSNGAGTTYGTAINDDLTFVHWMTLAAELVGDTPYFGQAKGFLDAWLTKFPTLESENADPFGEKNKTDYYPFKIYQLCSLVDKLHKNGKISDNDLTTIYLPKLAERINYTEPLDITYDKDAIIEMLCAEITYHNLRGDTTIPDTMCGMTVTDIVNYVNNTSPYGHAIEFLWRAYASWGVTTTSVLLTVIGGVGGTVVPAGTLTLQIGATYQFTATPNAEYLFDHWDLNGTNISSANPLGINVNADLDGKTLTGVFRYIGSIQIMLNVTAGPNGAVAPSGSMTLNVGQPYSFGAIPNSGYLFDHWDISGANIGSTNPITITTTADMNGKTLTALFTVIPPVQITFSIAIIGQGTTIPGVGIHTFNVGDSIQFAATPNAGVSFQDWKFNGTTYTDNPLTMTITNDMNGKTLTAKFQGPIVPAGFPLWMWIPVGLVGVYAIYKLVKKKP